MGPPPSLTPGLLALLCLGAAFPVDERSWPTHDVLEQCWGGSVDVNGSAVVQALLRQPVRAPPALPKCPNLTLVDPCTVALEPAGSDGLGAVVGRVLLAHLGAAAEGCAAVCDEPVRSHIEHSTLIAPMPRPSSKPSSRLYCHATDTERAELKQQEDALKRGVVDSAWWAQMRCHEVELLDWLDAWLPCRRRQAAATCAYAPPPHERTMARVADGARGAQHVSASVRDIRASFRRRWFEPRQLDTVCGLSSSDPNVIDFAVHLRLGDRRGHRNRISSTLGAVRKAASTLLHHPGVRVHVHLHSEGDVSEFADEVDLSRDRSACAGAYSAELLRTNLTEHVHVRLDADPMRTVDCLASADLLLLSSADSSFSILAATLSNATKLHYPTRAMKTVGARLKELLIAGTPAAEWISMENERASSDFAFGPDLARSLVAFKRARLTVNSGIKRQ